MNILLVEDRDELREVLATHLASDGHQVGTAADGKDAALRIKKDPFDVILSDLRLPGLDGLQLLAMAREECPDTLFVIMTAYGSVPEAVQAMKGGAWDFLTKPVEPAQLNALLGRAAEIIGARQENARLRARLRAAERRSTILGESRALRQSLALAAKVAPSDFAVLLLGESGTGKEVFAREIHRLSTRFDGPFVAINCASIPEGLLENELFGHEKGAFTGAGNATAGRFEAASGGTLFLDEIGDMPLALQAKILRAVQEKEVERIGSTRPIPVDVRLIAATHRDLPSMIAQGQFRQDLYYRIQGFPIQLPPLRERSDDIPILAAHFLSRAAAESGRAAPQLPAETLAALRHQPWPGNIRQLRNTMERCAILCGDVVRPEDLAGMDVPSPAPAFPADLLQGALDRRVEAAQPWLRRQLAREAMRRNGGNAPEAARELGIDPAQLDALLRTD